MKFLVADRPLLEVDFGPALAGASWMSATSVSTTDVASPGFWLALGMSAVRPSGSGQSVPSGAGARRVT
jgi:hypothetical protein